MSEDLQKRIADLELKLRIEETDCRIWQDRAFDYNNEVIAARRTITELINRIRELEAHQEDVKPSVGR